MAQWVVMLVAKPGDLNLMARTRVGKWRALTMESYPLTSIGIL